MVELQSVEIQLKHLGSPNYVIVLAVKIWDLYLHCFLKVLAPYLWKVPHSSHHPKNHLISPFSRSPLCLSSLAYTCRALKAASHAIAIHSDRSRLIVMRAVSVAVSLVWRDRSVTAALPDTSASRKAAAHVRIHLQTSSPWYETMCVPL